MKEKLEHTLIKSAFFVVFLFVVFSVFRIGFIIYVWFFHGNFFGYLENGTDIFIAILNGIKSDGKSVGAICSVYFLLNLMPKTKKIINLYVVIILGITALASIANMAFYSVYDDVFNIEDISKSYGKILLEMSFIQSIFPKIIWFIISCSTICYAYFKIEKILEKLYILGMIEIKNKIKLSLALITYCLCMLFLINGQLSFKGKSVEHIYLKNYFLHKISNGTYRDLYVLYQEYQER